jgi:glucosamine--fructose-6-phosphate aminotransferase (isomerizing)
MYLTEQELKGQFQAVARTLEALHAKRAEAVAALAGVQTLCALGCGSSFSLAKSAAIQFSQHTGVPAYALAAGDLLVNFPAYEKMLRGTPLLLLSRSGSTSEVVRAAERCKNELGCKLLSICAGRGRRWRPWPIGTWPFLAFDEAVCQTRTVTNLYVAALGLACIVGGDEAGLSALDALKSHATAFCPAQEAALSALAAQTWSKAVVLADSGMAGLLEEGALAFKEICRRDSNHYHLLDVRHGPMVQIGADTLVIAVLSSGDRALQAALLSDVARKTGHLLVLDCASSGDALPGTRIQLPECGDDDAKAVFALFCIQLLCFHHAIARGVDPDKPEGLDPWIKL